VPERHADSGLVYGVSVNQAVPDNQGTGGPLRRGLASIDHAAADALQGRFFAVPPRAPRSRRPTDITMVIISALVFAVLVSRSDDPMRAFERSIIAVADAIPSFLDPLWRIVHDVQVLWAVLLVLVAVFRRQWQLVLSTASALALVFAVGTLVFRLLNGDWPDLSEGLFHLDLGVKFPAIGIAVWVACASVASTFLSRPYRFFGRSLIVGAAVSSVALGSTTPSVTLGAVSLGLMCAAAVHLVIGSPGGIPSANSVRQILQSMGVDAEPRSIGRRRGVVVVDAQGWNGEELDVKIYGRDAWDGQLLVKLWRFFWYRDSGTAISLSRLQQVEHEAFLTLLAERNGVPVDYIVAADKNVIGDAVLVVRRDGPLLSDVPSMPNDLQLDAMWAALAALHRTRIAHGAVDGEHLRVVGIGARIADLASGSMASGHNEFYVDRSQLLVTTAIAAGIPVAIAAARRGLGDDGLAEVASFVQPAALTSHLRKRINDVDFDVDQLRTAVVEALGLESADLQKLRRLSLGGVLTALVLFVAGYMLVSGLTEVGLETIVDAMRDASLPILIGAFLVSSFGRFMGAVALNGISPTRVPLGRLTVLQFAQTFVSLAMPSTAGRVAINIRFFQRNGVEPTTAVAMGATDGFSGFLCQLGLMGSILLFGLGSLDLQLSADFDVSKIRSLVIWLAVLLVIGIGVIALVPVLRNWVIDKFQKVRWFLVPFLKSPRRLATAFGANCAAELVGALTLFTVLTAFGQSVNYLDVVLVSIFVALFAGLMPVPGGIGVSEAALTAGFIAIGVPEGTAFAAALTCRMITFYLPPILGAFAFRWLRNEGFL
jgi:uncharacterized membrane protein YbhN (UPF0104 family)